MKKSFSFIFFYIFFLINKSLAFNAIENNISNEELNLVLKILLLSYKRSFQTIKFWKKLDEYLIQYKNSILQIISRIRNPSINLNKDLVFINIDLNELLEETKKIYDEYANLLNESFKDNKLSKISKEYINFAKSSLNNNKNYSFISSFKSFIKIIKDKFILNKINFLKDFIPKKNISLISMYVKIDNTLFDIYEKYCDWQILLNNKYKDFWFSIESLRLENIKNAYNELAKNNNLNLYI